MKKSNLIFLCFIFFVQFSRAEIIYADNSLSSNCLTAYNPFTRTCGGGTAKAFNTLTGAAAVAVAGDTVLIRAGTYHEQLSPVNSGTSSKYIVFKNYLNEQPLISGNTLNPAVWIYQKNYIVIEGLKIMNVLRWLNALGSNYIIIRNNTFKNANDPAGSSKTGLFFQSSDYNQILNNIIDSTMQDNVALVHSNHNLVEGNTMTRAAHALWAIKCGSYNVLRNNYFHNALQKIGEIYDCDDVGYGGSGYPKISSLDDTKYNVVENNVFAFTSTPIDASPYAGIQHAGQHSIIRRNIFYNCIGPPVDLTLYSAEATFNYGNRIYHNVFFNNEFGGISISGSMAYTFYDNVFKNNILYRNRFTQYDNRWAWYTTLHTKPVQIITGRTTDVFFERNNIFNSQADELWVIVRGDRTSSSNPAPQTLTWWQSNYPVMFKSNFQSDPMFVDTAIKDFHLSTLSPMIDEGVFLAKTTSGGIGTTMVIDSAGYFRDGFGITGLSGDTIQLQGQTQYAMITAINYATNTLTLSTSLSWTSGQRLSLKYNGNAPDLGAFETTGGVTGIITSKYEEDLFIYPNPSAGIFYLDETNRQIGEQITSVEIYNSTGSKIYKFEASNGLTINISDQPKGIYFVRISTEGRIVAQKIIVQ